MRRAILLVLGLALVAETAGADAEGIRYTPPQFLSCASGAFCAPTGTTSLRLSNGSNAEYLELAWSSNITYLQTVVNGGTARDISLNPATGTLLFTGSILRPSSDDTTDLGLFSTPRFFKQLGLTRAIQGGKSKALADNSATNFESVSIPQTAGSNYASGQIIYTIFCKDAANQATQTGTVKFACHNLAGTESCGFSTPDGVTLGDGTASIGAPTFAAAGGTDVAVLSVQSDCTGVTPTTFTMEFRVDMPHPNTVTPQ